MGKKDNVIKFFSSLPGKGKQALIDLWSPPKVIRRVLREGLYDPDMQAERLAKGKTNMKFLSEKQKLSDDVAAIHSKLSELQNQRNIIDDDMQVGVALRHRLAQQQKLDSLKEQFTELGDKFHADYPGAKGYYSLSSILSAADKGALVDVNNLMTKIPSIPGYTITKNSVTKYIKDMVSSGKKLRNEMNTTLQQLGDFDVTSLPEYRKLAKTLSTIDADILKNNNRLATLQDKLKNLKAPQLGLAGRVHPDAIERELWEYRKKVGKWIAALAGSFTAGGGLLSKVLSGSRNDKK